MSHNQGLDQAEGLRRMLGPGTIRIISFISAVPPAQKNEILQNLAAALVQTGSEVHQLVCRITITGIFVGCYATKRCSGTCD